MTVNTSIDPARLLEEQLDQASPDLLRELLGTFINTLLSAEADAVCGAAYGTVSPERTNRRNGYRHRDFDTRAGTLDVAVPKLREGSYFPEWLLERRKRDVALTHALAQGALLRACALAVREALLGEDRWFAPRGARVGQTQSANNDSVLKLSNGGSGTTYESVVMPQMTPQPSLALTWEDHDWSPQGPPVAMPRALANLVDRPYRAAVPAPISAMRLHLRDDTAAAAEDARAEIIRFDAELSDAFTGEFAPLASVLLRTESTSSSQIENITAGSRALALAELGLARYGSNAGLVVANVDAMQRALELADDVTPDNILAIHEALMHGQDHAEPGRFRTQQVWIGGGDLSPHNATFVPPHHARVKPAITDLCAFVARTDLPLVAHAAIAHAQFETIHPFNDGNGRTGRALVHAMLKHGRATTRTTVPVSAGLLADTDAYFAALTAYRQGDPNPIVKRFNNATFAAIHNGRRLAADLKVIHGTWNQQLTARRDSVAWRILPILLSQPAVTSKFVQERTGASQPAVDRALRQLVTDGIATSRNEHGHDRKRDIVWRSDEVISALDTFADRARRQRSA